VDKLLSLVAAEGRLGNIAEEVKDWVELEMNKA